MITAPEILRCDLVYRLGWALLHSWWQIALVASVLAALLAALRRRSANLRYVVGCAGLAAMFVLPMVTYCVIPNPLRPESAAVAIPPDNPAAASVDHSPARGEPPPGTRASARPPDSEPSGAGAERGSLPLSSRPSPEFTPAAEPATPLAELVSQALLPWIPWFVVVWVVGVFSLSVWHLGGWAAMQRLKHLATTPTGPDGARRLAELIERMRLSRPVRMFQSAMVDVPAVIGWLRPVLLVPAAMLGELLPQQIDAVLAHELAHVRRYDYLVNLLQALIETLLFYHPAVWWLSRRIRIERENCCDDAAVVLCGSRVDYAATLMALEQGRLAPRLAVAASRADRAGTALSRVRRVLGFPSPDLHGWRASLGGGFGVLLLIGTLAGYVATGAAHDQGPGEKTTLPLPAAKTAASLLGDFRTAGSFWAQAEVGKRLIALGDKNIVPDMVKMLKSEDRRTRCNAGWVLAGLGDQRGLTTVLAELTDAGQRPTKMIRSDGKPNVPGQIQQDRYYAVHVLGEIGDQRAVPELIEALKDESINYKAAIVLGSLGDRRAIPALKQMLEHCQPDQRLWAGSGLARLGDPLGVPTVAEFLKHPQWTQRRHAADALGESQDKRAVAPLIDALKDKQAEVRASAARALGRLADQAAIPALEALLDDHEVTTSGPPTAVGNAAAEAIRQIRGAAQPTARAASQPKPPLESEQSTWGPAVEGVQVRLRAGQSKWIQGIVPRLAADVRNAGKRDLWVARAQQLCELEVDGRWYRWAGGMDVKGSGFLPGRQYDDIPVSLVSDWASDGKPLILGPGKHSIRVAFIASPSRDDAGGPVRAVSNPVEIEITAEKIQWGQKAEGLQAGLVFDMQERPYHVGELVSFRLYVRNMGDKAVELVDSVGVNPPRDDAPLIGWAPSVHDAAGKPLPVGMAPMDVPVLKRRRSLPAGETMLVGTVSLRLDSRPDRGGTPFLSLQPGTYRVSQKCRFAADAEATWSGELASGELWLKVVAAETRAEGSAARAAGKEGAEADWGPAVEGVQCRLEAGKPAWQPAEMLTLKAYVRHQTETTLFLSNHPMFGAQLQVDGHWHRFGGAVPWAGPSHSSSKFRTQDQQPLAIALDANWQQIDNKEPLRVDPGRHVIRFAWEGHPEKGPREGPDEQRSVVLLSNPLEIIVPSERPQPKPSDVHADERNAAAALQQLGAILAADDQGKIRSVRLSRTAVTDADLGHLKGLSGLKTLYLDDTRITDAALQHLAGLTGLETLSVNYTRISDAGLEHLKGLKGLQSLALLDSEVTAAALRELKKTRPELRTTVDPLKLSGLGDLRGWRNSAKLNDEYELVSVDLLDANITDTALARLKGRQSLQDVCLAKANITDAGLAELRKLTDLHTLYLSGTRITDAGLDCLKDMTKLKTLFLADTQIGDAGLARLSHLTNLESLLIDGTQVTDAGMAHLKRLTKLTLLRLNNCQISGAGLSQLRDLTKLTALELNGTAVSDTGLVHLQPLVNLELLYLSHTSVTDAGLTYLTGLRKLRGLQIEDTAVTDEGIQRLKQVLPNASVYR